MPFEPVIGLEVHAQLKTRTKIFCGCSTAFGADPNTHVCPVCLGMPGVLPVLNRQVVEFTLRTAIATGCRIARESRFARKNYFYPDLPKGYQISQYELPIANGGFLEIDVDGNRKRIGINRIHMEEDAGKLSHAPHDPVSRVDFNRTGVPLIEIVSEPDLRSPEQAGSYLRKLRSIVRHIGVCDGNMEEGSFRCDANVSVRPVGTSAFGTRTEIKNINSFKFVEKAIGYEIKRQTAVLEDGGRITQETRLWDAVSGRTVSMRGKEEAHDYRYFPDPDLLPLVIDDDWIASVRAAMPELPDVTRDRFVRQYGLSDADAQRLTASRELADFFEACLAHGPEAKSVCNWVMGPLQALLKTHNLSIDQSPVTAGDLAALLKLVEAGKISGQIAKKVFSEMAESGQSPQSIVEHHGWLQMDDTGEIEALIEKVLTENPEEVAAYRNGKTKLLGFFVGQVMRATKGQANPKTVNSILQQMLSKA